MSKLPANVSHPGGFLAGFDDYMERREPGYRARRAMEAAARRQKDSDDLEALIQRYGSREAVLRPSQVETTLVEAVRLWAVWYAPPYDPRWIASIDGATTISNWPDISGRVRDAIAEALPRPTTVTLAYNEVQHWRRRGREIDLICGDMGDTSLDLSAYFREMFVRRLFSVELRSSNVSEILLRPAQHCRR